MLNELAQKIPERVEQKIAYSRALQHLDSISLEEWVDANAGHESLEVRMYLKDLAAGGLAQPAKTLSLLYYLQAVKSFGSIEVDEGLRGGAQDSQLLEGTQAISTHLTAAIMAAGGQVHRNVTTASIERSASGVVVRTAEGQAVAAKHVIVAMGSGDRKRITHSPPLPAEYSAWSGVWPNATSHKIHLVYPEATWRAKGANFTLPKPNVWALGALMLWDNGPPSGKPGVVMVLTAGLLPEPLFRHALSALVGLQFGVWNPTDYFHQVWSGPTAKVANCVGAAPPGAMTKYGTGWRTPLDGRVYWAGSDTADEWQGYISGAIDSGRRAAREVADALKREARSAD